MILQQTCPRITDLGTTLVAVTHKNQNKQSKDNTKKNRIRRTLKKAKETDLEDHPRKVKSSLNKASVVDTRASSSVIKSVSNVNSNLKCASCNGCLFSDNHDKCVVEYINSVNASRKSKSAKKPVNRKVWKTTGKVFKTVGYKWTPTGWTFTLVGNVCPLTRIATATIVPPREPIPIVQSTDKPVVKILAESDYGLVFNKITMYCDNKSAIALCCSNVQHSRNMATTIEQQTVLDESLVPSMQRLRIGRSNFRLPSDIQSKEATLQVVYDEFWATAKLHHNSIRFKIDTRKSVLDLEAFREMLHISPRIPNQPFADLPTEEEILDFLRNMATTIEQQTALDESLVPSSQRLRIGRSNFRLPSDIQSKEATLQVVYDVLRNSPLFRAFQVTADVPEIYMKEFWATAKLHHNSIRFKIETRKSVLDLEAFREMLHISPRIPNQPFADLPTEEEVLEFLRFLGHSHDIRYPTDVNVNKLYQPWRSFASVINKCLTGKSLGVDSLRSSQAQLLWGFYHRINIDFAYLIWEDFVY
nr:hypothetical protein [Tanacetum cinerariifolium]